MYVICEKNVFIRLAKFIKIDLCKSVIGFAETFSAMLRDNI